MNFGLALYLSNDLSDKSTVIQEYSDKLSNYFSLKNYGDGLKGCSIGIICVSPQYEEFFKPRKPKFTKSKTVVRETLKTGYDHVFECDVKLDYDIIKRANNEDILKVVASELLIIIGLLRDKKIKDFDLESFKRDLEKVL
jgi:hypothetical protein